MASLTSVGLIEETVALAQAGNRSLAEHHFRRVMQESSDSIEDPAIWLMMAWLAPSPQAMSQVLERFLAVNPNHELAQLGLRWSQGMANLATEPATDYVNDFGPLENSDPDLTQVAGNMAFGAIESNDQGCGRTPSSVDAVVQGITQTYGTPIIAATSATVDLDIWEAPDSGGRTESTDSTSQSEFDRNSTPRIASPLSVSTAKPQKSGSHNLGHSDSASPESTALNPTAATPTAHVRTHLDQIVVESPRDVEEQSPFAMEIEELDSIPANWPYTVAEQPEGKPHDQVASATNSEEVIGQSDSQIEVPQAKVAGGTGELSKSPHDSQTGLRIPEATSAGTQSQQEDRSNGGASKSKSSRPSILVVDDSATVRKLLTMMLTQAGYEVSTAVDGLDAVQTIASHVPQLIITDINMPRLDGYKLCKLVTRNVRTKHIPVVMISAGIIDRLRGKLSGCSGYLIKPITPGSLNAVVEFALQGAPVH